MTRRNIPASDREALIRLASSLPSGSEERRAILAGLSHVARVKSKSESMRILNQWHTEHGGHTKSYFEAVLKGIKDGIIAPAAVVGGGYKDGKKVAIKWLEEEIKSAPIKKATSPIFAPTRSRS